MTWYYTICAKKCQYYICWFDFMQLWMDKTFVLVFSDVDIECAPALIIIASNAAHFVFDVLCDLSVFDLYIFQHAYSTGRSLNGPRGWTRLHLRGFGITMMHRHRIGLLKDGKVSNTATRSMSTNSCHWSPKTGTREQRKQWTCPGKEQSAATISSIWRLHSLDHPQLDKFTCINGKFYCILSNIGNIM